MKHDKILIALKKANSLTSKLITMAQDDVYCIDLMQQNLAAIGLLKAAHQSLLENHLQTCFANAMASKNEKLKQQMIAEILKVSKLSFK